MKQKRTYAVDTVPVATDIRQRASDLGLIEELLRLAHHDPAWRARVERALTKDRLLGKSLPGGSKVADVWRRSLLRRQFVQKLEDDPVAFDAFATAHPRVAELAEAGDEHNPDVLQEFPVIERVLAAYTLFVGDTALYGTALADACDELERQAEHCAEDPHDDSAADTVPTGEFETQPRALKESQTALLAAQKELKGVKAELRKSKADVSRRDRKAGELREELKAVVAERDELTAQARAAHTACEDVKRENRRLTALVDSSKTGLRTTETKRADETERMGRTITDLRERLAETQKIRSVLEERVTALEEELQDERARRESFEVTLRSFGIDNVGASARGLQSALDTLERFQKGLIAYSAEQAEQENERIRKHEEAEQRRQAAETALRLQDDMDRAWELRERSRLEECERALFQDRQVDYMLIDGHNLVHRVFRPEDEARTRPWLEHMVELMAEGLEQRGWDTKTELVFDTKSSSNSRPAGRGVTVHFHNNVSEGGADARILQLLEEGSPDAHYMVVSTDRRHVWSAAEQLAASDGIQIDFVQVELLAQYLQTLDDLIGE